MEIKTSEDIVFKDLYDGEKKWVAFEDIKKSIRNHPQLYFLFKELGLENGNK